MGMMTGVESFLSIGIPVLATFVYGFLNFSFYFIVAALPLLAILVNRIFFSSVEFRKTEKN